MNEEAIDDSWTVASYLSDADTLLASIHSAMFRNHEAENLGQSVAASVASRGVLFGNSCPLSSRSAHSDRRELSYQYQLVIWRRLPILCIILDFHSGGMPFGAQSYGRLSNLCLGIRFAHEYN